MEERKPTREQVEGRRMLMGVSRYRIAIELGYSEAHVNLVLRGKTTSRPVLDKTWAYLDRVEAERLAEAA